MYNHKPNKIQPLENPYHKSSVTIATDTKSQLFLLNDRSKVAHSESSDTESLNFELKN